MTTRSAAEAAPAGRPIVVCLQRSLEASSDALVSHLTHLLSSRGFVLKTELYAEALPRDQVTRYGGGIGRTVRNIAEAVRPVGFVVEHSPTCRIPSAAFGGLPVVTVDSGRLACSERVSRVSCDDAAIARAAADELLSLGFPNFAYVRWFTRPVWSVEREAVFRRILATKGFSPAVVTCPKPERERLSAISRQVAALPKPCAVFAVNDFIARYVVDACTRLGLSVPNDVAVVGVDNNAQICERLQTTLSSVAVDCRSAASAACAALERMLNGGAGVSLAYGADGVVRRASTRLLKRPDAMVARAMEFIRLNYARRIVVADVAHAAGVSAATLQRRFVLCVGHGVGEEISDARFAAAQRLLRSPDCVVTSVANLCGYESDSTLRYAFRSRLGVSPRTFAQDGHWDC